MKNFPFHEQQAGKCAMLVAQKLRHPGAVLLLPTETVYGLICRADDQEATEKIYTLKRRDPNRRLTWFVRDYSMALQAGLEANERIYKLFEAFVPGPITIIGRSSHGKEETLGVRCPDHLLYRELFKLIDYPLASTSANRSGEPNALSVAEAEKNLDGEVDLILDNGPLSADSRASTVVSVIGDVQILRPGPVTMEEIQAVLAT